MRLHRGRRRRRGVRRVPQVLTSAATYHIEFRYGSDLDQLLLYFKGPYAYWLSAGIDQAADETTIHNVIDLFVTENLSE